MRASEIVSILRPLHASTFSYTKLADSPLIKRYPGKISREAAVLLPLILKPDNTIDVLLTLRSDQVRHHKNEVSFPGGSREIHDASPVDTALRESYEEIGLPLEQVKVVTQLTPVLTRFTYLLFPVVGIIQSAANFDGYYKPLANCEVDKCFTLPLSRFLSTKGHVEREIGFKGGKTWKTHFFQDCIDDNVEVVTYGITALMAIELASLVLRRKPEFPVNVICSWDANVTSNEILRAQEQRLMDWLTLEDWTTNEASSSKL